VIDMTALIRMARKTGITLSRSITLILILFYVAQTAILVHLLLERTKLQEEIIAKDAQIAEMERQNAELREKLKIFEIIDDFQRGFTPKEVQKIGETIFDQSRLFGYDPLLLMALILTESSFRKGEESEMGALGLMQLLPSTGYLLSHKYEMPWKDESSLFDPHYNIRMGSYYLFELILKYGDVKKALVAYNIGEYAMEGRISLKMDLPRGFVNTVMKKYEMLKSNYPDSLFG